MDLSTPKVHEVGNQLHVSHGDDKGLYVEFYMEAVHQPFKSEKEGRPIFDDVPHVRILFPGDNTKKVVRPVDMKGNESKPSDPQRWPNQWAAFQAQASQAQTGTPLTEWPPIAKSVAMSLKASEIHTVEQLAEVPDHSLTWLGARELRDKAKVWLAASRDSGVMLALQQENANLKADIETLKKQFATLAAGKPAAEATTEKAKK